MIVWDKTGERFFEVGADHGVLYLQNRTTGEYEKGVAWNGLVSVSDNPSGAEANAHWADNIKYLNLIGTEQWGGTIEAFTYPDEFAECDGSADVVPGLSAGQQRRNPFGFSYRTKVGNDVQGHDYGYKIHLVYGAQASPSQKQYQTINENPEPITFSWEITTTPVSVPGLRPTATLSADSTKIGAAAMATLENILYQEARLPLPAELVDLLGGQVTTTTTTTTTTQG